MNDNVSVRGMIMSQSFCIHVSQRDSGYLVKNETLSISVGGASAVDAAAKARAVVTELLACYLREALPAMAIAETHGLEIDPKR